MGLDFNHSEAHWSYSGFMRFRERLARLDGYDLRQMWEDEENGVDYTDLPMYDFYFNSDCDGELTPEQMERMLPRFRELIKMMEDEDIEDDWDVEAATMLADDMQDCIDENEPLIFC